MSALSIGSSTFPSRLPAGPGGAPVAPTREDGLTVVVKWVPGEVIGAYTAVVLALQGGQPGASGSAAGDGPTGLSPTVWLWVFAAAALLMAWVGGALEWRRQNPGQGGIPGEKRVELALRGVLAMAAFLLWSLVIPGSAAAATSFGQGNARVLPVVVPFAAIVFGLVAEYAVLPPTIGGLLRVVRRWQGRPSAVTNRIEPRPSPTAAPVVTQLEPSPEPSPEPSSEPSSAADAPLTTTVDLAAAVDPLPAPGPVPTTLSVVLGLDGDRSVPVRLVDADDLVPTGTSAPGSDGGASRDSA